MLKCRGCVDMCATFLNTGMGIYIGVGVGYILSRCVKVCGMYDRFDKSVMPRDCILHINKKCVCVWFVSFSLLFFDELRSPTRTDEITVAKLHI